MFLQKKPVFSFHFAWGDLVHVSDQGWANGRTGSDIMRAAALIRWRQSNRWPEDYSLNLLCSLRHSAWLGLRYFPLYRIILLARSFLSLTHTLFSILKCSVLIQRATARLFLGEEKRQQKFRQFSHWGSCHMSARSPPHDRVHMSSLSPAKPDQQPPTSQQWSAVDKHHCHGNEAWWICNMCVWGGGGVDDLIDQKIISTCWWGRSRSAVRQQEEGGSELICRTEVSFKNVAYNWSTDGFWGLGCDSTALCHHTPQP